MRELTDHKVNGLNEALKITVVDEPGAGGANRCYYITGFGKGAFFEVLPIIFQNDPIKEADVNGISIEALLAISIDRLRCFQAGEYACSDNAIALTHLEDALMRLQRRTRECTARGVEGTSTK